MRKRDKSNTEVRLLGIEELCEYTSLGRSSAVKLGKTANAEVRMGGRRVLYDRLRIDQYIEGLTKTEEPA